MAYTLSWRKRNDYEAQLKQTVKLIRDNPGFRWKSVIQEEDKPINYLEIGIFKGENLIDVSKSYCKHPDSRMYCVDPWIDYDEYSEYKGKITKIYDEFVTNMNNEKLWNKIKVYRDFSHNVIPTFENEFFDLVFIDGNHETEFVYKDAQLTLPKVKSGGYIIFDDYTWPETKLGIHKFITENNSSIKQAWVSSFQFFIQKL